MLAGIASPLSAAPPFPTPPTKSYFSEEAEQEMVKVFDRYKDKISTLPKDKDWVTDHMYNYQGFWYKSQRLACIEGVMAIQDNFRAHPTDILLATHPKSGTGWLKALGFAIVTRNKFKDFSDHHPLLTTNPRTLIPLIELSIYERLAKNVFDETPDSPRLLATHIPYSSLPESFITSGCRIVYMCRNPKDVLVSRWFYDNKMKNPASPSITLEYAFEMFTKGVSSYGLFWDHVLEYHKASLEHPRNVLFLKYDEVKKDPASNVKRMAEFLGFPLSEEEVAEGMVEKIVELCSFEKMSSLQVNKNGFAGTDVKNEIFFRKGTVGDSVNHLTPAMIETIDRITEEKFRGTSITF